MSSTPPSKILRVLHIGVGNRGTWPLRLCNAQTGFQPAALCDVNPTALTEARASTGLPESVCFSDYHTAISNSKVDCVIVCAATIFHVPMAKAAMDAKIPVLVEKGMAPDWNAARDLVKAADKKKAIACVSQNYRYFSGERTIWRAIHDPAFSAYVGKVHLITYTQNRVRPIPRTLIYPFASVWDMSCHHFDNLLYWLGPMQQMTAFSWRADWSPYQYDNNTTAQMEFANGTHVHYIHTHDAARANLEVQVHGERGALVRREDQITFNERPLEQFGSRPIMDVPKVEAHGESDLLRDFHAYITQGIEPGISARNNLETMSACEMMVRSITQKRTCRRDELNG